MAENLGDDLVLEDDTDDLHSAATAGTHHRIDLVHPSYKTCPRSSPGSPFGVGHVSVPGFMTIGCLVILPPLFVFVDPT